MKLGPDSGVAERDWFGLAQFAPGPRFRREGSRLYLLDEVGSSNDFLRGRGAAAPGRLCRWESWGWNADPWRRHEPPTDVPAGTVVVARRQTDGRGRQGRAWADCGGLHLSVHIPARYAPAGRGFSVWLGLLTVLELRESLRVDARLKWPNDIMVGGRKLGGILLERVGGESGFVVGGLGLNLDTQPGDFPAELQASATSLRRECGRSVVRGVLAGGVIRRIEEELPRFREAGWGPFRPSLALVDCLLGRDVRLAFGDRRLEGRAEGIDDSGRLLVRDANDGQPRAFGAGDVHLLPADRGEARS